METSGLDFERPEARFCRVLASFVRDFGPLGRKNAGTDFELEVKAAQFQLGAQVGRSSYFYAEFGRDLLHRSQAEMLRRSGWAPMSPAGSFNPPATEGVPTACETSAQLALSNHKGPISTFFRAF